MKSFREALSELSDDSVPRYHKDDPLDDKILFIFKGRCVVCGRRTIVVHEIVPRSHGESSLAAENRVPLCGTDHDLAHADTTYSIPNLQYYRSKTLKNLGLKDG
jgi:5-methylcytosine-specific restriction endonuclease McrA